MVFLKLFKPKWQHKDPAVRLAAVKDISPDETDILSQVILEDTDKDVRQCAIESVNDIDIIKSLTDRTDDSVLKRELNIKLDKLLVSNVLRANDYDEKFQALQKIHDENLLLEIAINEENIDIRLEAVSKINEQNILAQLLTNKCGKVFSLNILDKITEHEILAKVSKTASNRAARAKANSKLKLIEAELNQPSSEQILNEKIGEIIPKLEKLAKAMIFEDSIEEFNRLRKSFSSLNLPDNHSAVLKFSHLEQIISDKIEVFLKEKKIQEEKEKYFSEQYDRLNQIIGLMVELRLSLSLETDSDFKKLQDEWQQITTKQIDHDISHQLLDRYKQVCRNYNDARKVIVVEQKEEKTFLANLAEAVDLFTNNKINKSLNKLKLIKDDLAEWKPQFLDKEHILSKVFEQVKICEDEKLHFKEKQEAILQANYDARKALSDEVIGIIAQDYSNENAERVNDIKKIIETPVGLPEGKQEIIDDVLHLIQQFHVKQQNFFKERDWLSWQNKNLKEELIETVKGLGPENDLHKVFKIIQECQKKWRDIGPAPPKIDNKLWNQFKELTDKEFLRCQLFFKELDEQANMNLEKKMELCRKASECEDSTDWQKTSIFLIDLQKKWQTIGRVPKDKEGEIYTVFRTSCNTFFDRRKKHYEDLDRQRSENLKNKEELCQKVESLMASPSVDQNNQIRDIQTEWKAIGPVPKAHDELVWKRFRAACDSYYTWLDSLKPENLAKKEALCLELEKLTEGLSDKTNFKMMSPKISDLQNKWKTIGPVPDSEKDKIWERFQGPINNFFNTRRNFFDAIDRQRPENQTIKLEILAKVKELAKLDTRESAREIIDFQEKWKSIGPASKEMDNKLSRDFEELLNNFFIERRHAFEEMDRLRRQNLKELEALCLRLEIIAGISHKPKNNKENKGALTLAEQLKVAFESNFVMSGEDNKKKRVKDEIELIQEESIKIGQLPKEHEFAIKNRFEKALIAAKKLQ